MSEKFERMKDAKFGPMRRTDLTSSFLNYIFFLNIFAARPCEPYAGPPREGGNRP
jgi:hypothetical protein